MRRIWAGCVAALTLLGASAAEAASIQDEFLAALKSMQQGRCDAGRMRKITTRPQFAELSGAQRSMVWASLAVCDSPNQHEFALKAVAEPDAVAMAHGVRFADAVEREETDAALAALDAIAAAARDGDDSVVWFGDDYVYELARKVDEEPAKFRRFMAGLEGAAWKAESPHYGGDWMFARYAGMLASAGERAHAWRVVARIEDPVSWPG